MWRFCVTTTTSVQLQTSPSFLFPWLCFYSDHYIHIYVESILGGKVAGILEGSFCFTLRSFKTRIYCVNSENKILFCLFFKVTVIKWITHWSEPSGWTQWVWLITVKHAKPWWSGNCLKPEQKYKINPVTMRDWENNQLSIQWQQSSSPTLWNTFQLCKNGIYRGLKFWWQQNSCDLSGASDVFTHVEGK